MRLYSENKDYKLYSGSMLDMLEHIPAQSIDRVVTDPPYELNFMNKGWDNSGIAFKKETWEKCYKVLKPGGYLLAFGGSRTFHRIACAIEEAGFEMRDTIMWLYGSGFPKSMNIGLAVDKKNGVESPVVGQNQDILKKQAKDLREGRRKIADSFNNGAQDRNNGFKTVSANIKEAQNEWKGWGTCLKPSFEPIIVARKPFKGSLVDNVIEYGVGGLNIDECRVPFESTPNPATNPLYRQENGYKHNRSKSIAENSVVKFSTSPSEKPISSLGRFPANTILTYDETDYEEVCGGFPQTISSGGRGEKSIQSGLNGGVYMGGWNHQKAGAHIGGFGDRGSASRYFYCAKASKKDRDEGLAGFEEKISGGMIGTQKQSLLTGSGNIRNNLRKNTHPTVKPTTLMQYLIRLVTPNGGTILDPFNGSGSTGKAVMYENKERNKDYKYIGIELMEEYLPIAKARIEYPLTSNK